MLKALRHIARILLLLGVAAAAAFPAAAVDRAGVSVTLAWEWSTNSDVVGYNLYYGVASQTYTNRIQVGNVTNATISGLVSGTTYFFAATATDSVGLESEFSNEVTYTVKPVLVVTADNVSRPYGATNVTLTGTLTGVQNGDNITATYTTSASANSPVGTYSIVPTLNDPAGKLSNYTVSFISGTSTVTPAPLTVSADAKSKLYGTPDPPLTCRLTSGALMNGDNLNGSLSRIAGEDIGSYAIQQGTLTAGSNYTLTYVGADLTITPANVILGAGEPQPDGNFKITAWAVPNQTYLIEGSTDLAHWTVLSTNVADANGLIQFVDLNATNHPFRFYRTATP